VPREQLVTPQRGPATRVEAPRLRNNEGIHVDRQEHSIGTVVLHLSKAPSEVSWFFVPASSDHNSG
jgi:hypothetical protein